MDSATPVPWVTLISAFGIGSVMAAVVGWVGAKAVTISNHRQNWINALREDIVLYLKEIDSMHYRISLITATERESGTTVDMDKHQETRIAALAAYRRVLLRLNMTEPGPLELGQSLEALMTIKSRTADKAQMDAVVTSARRVLKYEWAVTKYGIFTTPILCLRSCWRRWFSPRTKTPASNPGASA